MSTIGLLHPGAMGAEVGRDLTDAGHRVLWSSPGRSPATRQRAEEAGLRDAGPRDDLLAASDVILSICPPDAAPGVAAAIAGFGGPVVDANAVAPSTASGIAATIGPTYVDGGIVGPPPTRAGTTRLFLSGTGAASVAELFTGTRIEPVVLEEGGPWAASALKMTYAAWTKGTAALILATEDVARTQGVADALHAEWARSQPDLATTLESARRGATGKGWRWVGEMQEIAATFAGSEAPDGFHRAAAEVYGAFPREGK